MMQQVVGGWSLPLLPHILIEKIVMFPSSPESIQDLLSLSPQIGEFGFILSYVWVRKRIHFSTHDEFRWCDWSQIIRIICYCRQWMVVHNSLDFGENH